MNTEFNNFALTDFKRRQCTDNNFVYIGYKIRRFTPRETFRLMDLDDRYINAIQAAGISITQQRKLAGNSIVAVVLFQIFKSMFIL